MFSDEHVPKYTLRETVDNLGDPFPLTARKCSEVNHYWRCGFMVQHAAISLEKIRAANIGDMKRHFQSSKLAENVFIEDPQNSDELERSKRRQIVTKKYKKDMRSFLSVEQRDFLDYCEGIVRTTAAAILKHKEVEGGLKVVESLLYSPAMNQEIQIPHRDLSPSYSEKAVLCLLALEDETTILLTRGTHSMDFNRRNYFISRYGLSKGDILFFHPLLIHAGDAYHDSNLRLHYYVFLNSTRWQINKTYLLTEEDQEMLRVSEANLVRNLNLMVANHKRLVDRAELNARKRDNIARRKVAMDAGRKAKRLKDNYEHLSSDESVLSL